LSTDNITVLPLYCTLLLSSVCTELMSHYLHSSELPADVLVFTKLLNDSLHWLTHDWVLWYSVLHICLYTWLCIVLLLS
jgi:hypothetical protein